MSESNSRLLVPVMAGAAALAVTAGSAYWLHRHRNTSGHALWRWRRRGVVHGTNKRVVVVETEQQWKAVEAELIRCSHELGCLGFDCEWVSAKAARRPVALLQLATHTGLCVLVRLCKLDTVPTALLEVMSDGSVLKVGVGTNEDCKLLYDDHSIEVNGAVDLRDLFVQPAVTGPAKKKKKRGKHKGSKLDDAFQAGLLAGQGRDAKVQGGPPLASQVEGRGEQDEERPEGEEDPTNAGNVNGNSKERVESSEERDVSGDAKDHNDFDSNSVDVRGPIGSEESVELTGLFSTTSNGGSQVNPASRSSTTTTTTGKEDGSTANSPSHCDATTVASQNGNETHAVTLSSSTNTKHNSSSRALKDEVSIRNTSNSDNNTVLSKQSHNTIVGGSGSGGGGVFNGKVVAGVAGPTKLGLSALADFYLGRTLDKDWRVRASDWEVEHLTVRQSMYAAEDARSGLHVLLMLLDLVVPLSVTWPLQPLYSWIAVTREMVAEIGVRHGQGVRRDDWKSLPGRKSIRLPDQSSTAAATAKGYRRAYSLRKSPLYHNSILWAPDDEPLCTVDPKKAYWYVDNGLGEVVQEDPLIVRLNFEPTGRPQKEGSDGNFYLNERENKCVVCGKDQSYIRKNVVPHEYRKHFPEILKSHQNHDVVLLCTDCHQLSNQRDAILRYKLAEDHDAPIGNATDVKVVIDGNLKMIKSAGNALLKNRDIMPAKRIEELTVYLKSFFDTDDLTDELITKAALLNVTIVNDSYEPHGLRVFKYYEKIGIINFERLWRENFLNTMKPQFMPTGWSINHNHEKLKLKMARHPIGDPIREQFRLALVGSEGHIDIPYKPQQHRPKRVLAGKRPKTTQKLNKETSEEEEEEGDSKEEETGDKDSQEEEGDVEEDDSQEEVLGKDGQEDDVVDEEDEKEAEKEWLSKYMYFKE